MVSSNKKIITLLTALLALHSCETKHYSATHSPKSTSNTTVKSQNNTSEFDELVKTYNTETEAVLNHLLNGTDTQEASIIVTNNTVCDLVLTILKDNKPYKKIPIRKNKGLGYAMLPKNENYSFIALYCGKEFNMNHKLQNSIKFNIPE